MPGDAINSLRSALSSAQSLRNALQPLLDIPDSNIVVSSDQSPNSASIRMYRGDIYDALVSVSQRLADGYAQVYADLSDPNRVSWAGTAHEIREVLATMLRVLGPDDDVSGMPWFKPETNDKRPTQKQRVRYILESRGAGSSEYEVAGQVDVINDRVGSLVRSTYSRASDAAHGDKGRREVVVIVNYFEAFSHDLLALP